MAIEDIFRALDEQADSEVEGILRVGALQADAIETEAREEAERITATKVGSSETAARAKSEKALNAARLKARRDIAAVRDEAIEEAFDLARTRLAALRGTPDYERIFGSLMDEAMQGVTGSCTLLVASADRELAERLVAGKGVVCDVSPTLDTSGGLTVSLEGGRVLRVNTFESRLGKVRGTAGAAVAKILSGS